MKSREEIISEFMDDELYGTASDTIDVFDKETLRSLQDEYDEAQQLKELSFSIPFQLLLRKLDENAEYHARRQRENTKVDPLKKEELNQAQRNADYARDFVRGVISNAHETPKPVLKQLPQ